MIHFIWMDVFNTAVTWLGSRAQYYTFSILTQKGNWGRQIMFIILSKQCKHSSNLNWNVKKHRNISFKLDMLNGFSGNYLRQKKRLNAWLLGCSPEWWWWTLTPVFGSFLFQRMYLLPQVSLIALVCRTPLKHPQHHSSENPPPSASALPGRNAFCELTGASVNILIHKCLQHLVLCNDLSDQG